MKKRIMALLLSLVMALSLVPTTVWAADVSTEGADDGIREAGVIQHAAGLNREVSQISAVQTDSVHFGVDSAVPHLLKDSDGIGNTAPQGIIGID